MAWIRKSPFGRGEDPKEFMIDIFVREALTEGWVVTEEERRTLAGEITAHDVPEGFHNRTLSLVRRVIEREKETGESNNPRSFTGAVEWAGDMEYPYIVQLAEHVFGAPLPPPFRAEARSPFGVLALLVVIGALAILGWVVYDIFLSGTPN